MSIAAIHRAVKAIGMATDDLIVASWDLAESGNLDAAKIANRAAKRANESAQAICDEVLSRRWVRVLLWFGDRILARFTRAGNSAENPSNSTS